ncbi:MAG TPA: hypothetical protein DD670_10585 [Planctomycetaceae bacterium]|nr:hypothetical protein [Planctomycetaceae bacterium]
MPEIASLVGVVEEVLPGSSAGIAGVQAGDVILNCDGRLVIDGTVIGPAPPSGPRAIAIRRGAIDQTFKTEGGRLGVKLSPRWLPAFDGKLVAVDQSHLIKDRWLDAFRGAITFDSQRVSAFDCPAGTLRIMVESKDSVKLFSGAAGLEETERIMRQFRNEFDLATATMKDAALIVGEDVALGTARFEVQKRFGGERREIGPAGTLIFAKQDGAWHLLATLPIPAQVGLPEAKPGRKVDAKAVHEAIAGQMVGIGAKLERVDDGARIGGVLPNSPAERANLKVGSVITAVDGRPTAGLAMDDVVKLIVGPEGSTVALSLRLPDGSSQTFELVRAKFAASPVQSRRLADGILLLHFPCFNQTTPNDCREALKDFLDQQPRGLVVDLRGCTGGTLPETKAVAEMFLPAGSPLWGFQKDGGQPTKSIAGAAPRKLPKRIPVVVLIDKATRSAGVLLTHALKENGRAKLVGQETMAMNRPSSLVTDPDGGSRLVEFGDFLSVHDELLTGQTMKPDVAIPPDASEEVWIERAIELLAIKRGGPRNAGNASAPTVREWTDTTGKFRIMAEFLGLEDGNARLRKPDGTVLMVPLDRLSEKDREWIESDSPRSSRQ